VAKKESVVKAVSPPFSSSSSTSLQSHTRSVYASPSASLEVLPQVAGRCTSKTTSPSRTDVSYINSAVVDGENTVAADTEHFEGLAHEEILVVQVDDALSTTAEAGDEVIVDYGRRRNHHRLRRRVGKFVRKHLLCCVKPRVAE